MNNDFCCLNDIFGICYTYWKEAVSGTYQGGCPTITHVYCILINITSLLILFNVFDLSIELNFKHH